MEPIILASASPRRQDFFRLLGLPFACIPADIDETAVAGETPQKVAENIALRKVMAVVERLGGGEWGIGDREWGMGSGEDCPERCDIPRKHPHTSEQNPYSLLSTPHSPSPPHPLVFGADTIVVLENEIFGKPADRSAAKSMLERLSGRRHEVITAMALYNGRAKSANCLQADCRSVASEVHFAPLLPSEIDWYLDSGEWEGAAGAYRLQGRGACFISSIKGSPSGVAGLPLHEFYAMLRDNGCPLVS